MYRSLALVGALLLTTACVRTAQVGLDDFAQQEIVPEDSLFLDVVAWWSAGDVRELEVMEIKRKAKADSLTQDDTTLTRYRVTVLAETDTSYTMQWYPIDHDTNGEPPDLENLDPEAMWSLLTQGLQYQTDEWGAFQGLTNGAVLVDAIETLIDSLLTPLRAELTEEQIALFESFMEPLLQRENLENTLTAPIRLYHSLHGYQFLVGHDSPLDWAFPNQLGGPPIAAEASFVIDYLDTLNYEAHYTEYAEADTTSLREMLLDVMARASPDGVSDELRAELASFHMQLYQRATYVIGYDLGWIRKMDWEKVYQSGDSWQEHRYHMTLTDPAASDEEP